MAYSNRALIEARGPELVSGLTARADPERGVPVLPQTLPDDKWGLTYLEHPRNSLTTIEDESNSNET
jgi:hypothetical protein